MSSVNYPIIFIHLPRSGGSTLNSIIRNNFPRSKQLKFSVEDDTGTHQQAFEGFVKMPDDQKRNLLFLSGHFDFGLHKYYNNVCSYLTFFRHPVTRIVSYYNFVLSIESHFLHKTIIKNKFDLERLLLSNISTEFSNAHVRLLTGETGKCDATTLKKAIENFDNFFPVFGLMEYYDESLMLINNYFNFPKPYYNIINKARAGTNYKLTSEVEQLILETNQLDIELYNYAKEKFLKIIAAKDKQFSEQVIKFKQTNERLKKIKIGKYDVGIPVWNAYKRMRASMGKTY